MVIMNIKHDGNQNTDPVKNVWLLHSIIKVVALFNQVLPYVCMNV